MMYESEQIDLLIGADFLYPMRADGEIVMGGEVAVRADKIVYAGPRKDSGFWAPKRKISGSGKAVLPGFVNCHSHTGSILFRSQSDDGAGGAALYQVAFRGEKHITPEQWRDLAVVGTLDMIKAGITTINDIWYEPEALAEVCAQSGLRAQIAYKVFDVKLENLHAGDYTRHSKIGEQRLRRGVELVEAWHGERDGLICGRIGPHATDTCSSGLHREAGAEARRLGVGRHTHVAQSRGEVDYIFAEHGKGPAEYLRDLGELEDDTVVAHLTFASDADLDAMRETGARYAHCSTIYPRRGVYPDIPAINDRNLTWGLATDWMMNDPFEAMRNAMNALRLLQGRHDAFTSQQAMWRASAGSAAVLGLDGSIGELTEGYKADLIQIDLNQPHLVPFYGDYSSIAYYARASDVVTSVIDGRVVMEDREVPGLDEKAALAALDRHLPEWSKLVNGLGGVAHPGLCPCGHA